MSFRIHQTSPADAVEEAFFRIQREQMADVPILNPALSVEAVDFQRWQGHWLGIVVTPWCMSLLLVPGSAENWVVHGRQPAAFRQVPGRRFRLSRQRGSGTRRVPEL
jgi:[NiFe] hydrogenase assembly HybE family chaperone